MDKACHNGEEDGHDEGGTTPPELFEALLLHESLDILGDLFLLFGNGAELSKCVQ